MPENNSILSTLSPEQNKKLDLFAEILIRENQIANLTSVVEPQAIRIRHFEDCLTALPTLLDFEKTLDTEPTLIDVGSGAGFPGLVLALALPHWKVVSLEATRKKVEFQRKVVEALGLTNVEVIQDRAETLANDDAWRERFHIATSRGLAPLGILAELTLPFLQLQGRSIAWKGPRLEEERDTGKKACEILGGVLLEEIPYTLSETNPDVWPRPKADAEPPNALRLVILEKTAPTPPLYPRKPKDVRKRPLGH